MASRAVSLGFLYVFVKFGDVIGKGRPVAVLLGFVLGLGLGAIVMIESLYAGILTSILGGFVGALAGAILCPRAAVLLSDYASGEDGFGTIVDSLVVDVGMGICHTTVVMERALYIVSRSQADGSELPESVFKKLAKGVHPQIEGGNLIVLSNILHLEAPVKKYDLNIFHVSKGRPRRRTVEFSSREARAEYLSYLQRHMGIPFESNVVPMETRRAVIGPLIALIVTCVLTFLLTLLASHWTNDPPPPPMGKDKQDELVRGVIALGPFGFLLVGGAFVLVCLLWMGWRMKSPPLLNVIRPKRDASATTHEQQET